MAQLSFLVSRPRALTAGPSGKRVRSPAGPEGAEPPGRERAGLPPVTGLELPVEQRARRPGKRSKKIQILPQTASYIRVPRHTLPSHSSAKVPKGLPFLESGDHRPQDGSLHLSTSCPDSPVPSPEPCCLLLPTRQVEPLLIQVCTLCTGVSQYTVVLTYPSCVGMCQSVPQISSMLAA